MKTTLNKIKGYNHCDESWKLLTHLGKSEPDDETLSLLTILESIGLTYALWALRGVEGQDRDIRLFAVGCARRVQHLMTYQKSIDAIDVAERFANGQATEQDLVDAVDAAADGAWTFSACAALNAAHKFAWSAAWHAAAAENAAFHAVWRNALYSCDMRATEKAAEAEYEAQVAQRAEFIRMCKGE